jgi:hypothetical protein
VQAYRTVDLEGRLFERWVPERERPQIFIPSPTVRHMKPIGIAGVALILVGLVILALGGFSFTKSRESAQIGPIEVAAERRGFVPPVAGVAVLALGIVLVVVDRRNRRG